MSRLRPTPVPTEHDGSAAFTLRPQFSEAVVVSYVTLRDVALKVTNGTVTKAKRVDRRSSLWKITIEPDSDAHVTIVLPITTDCNAQGAVCTSSGTELSNRSEATVPGPAPADSGLVSPNSPATGAPTISGTAWVGETLTAHTSGIADPSAIEDAHGLNNAVYICQWLANDADIAGATSDTYTLADADEGKTIKVKVFFTDDRSYQETRTSDPTAAVAPKPNSRATGAPIISGTPKAGETLTAETSGIDDADGLSKAVFTYQWVRNDGSADADISGATGASYTLVDADEGKTIKVKVFFTDDRDFDETLISERRRWWKRQKSPSPRGRRN